MDDQTKSKCLQGLPNELLLKILGYLPCNFRLASVSRVCHHFNDLIDSFEMKSLDLNATFPEKKILNVKKSVRKKPSLYKLLQKFVHQQTRPTHTSWLPPSYNRFRRLCDQLEQHPKMLMEIRTMSLTVQDRSWYTSCLVHNRLLHSPPYLDHLTLSPPPPMSFWLLEHNPNYGLRALRSLRLDFLPLTAPLYQGNVHEDIVNVVDQYRYCSGLHKLRIDGLGPITVPFSNLEMTFIRDLWCVGCRACEAAVMNSQLIRSSTGLVRYIFETADTERSPFRPFPPQYTSFLYEDLLLHKYTLRQLVIATSNLGVIHDNWTLGPLNTFSQLEKLALPCFLLPERTLGEARFEMLPPNLEELQLEFPFALGRKRFGNEQTFEMLRKGASRIKFCLPYLKRLILWDRWNPVQDDDRNSDVFDNFSLKTLRELEQTFKDLDIEFEWLSEFSFWDTPIGKALEAEGNVIIEENEEGERNPITLHPTTLMV